MPDTLRAQQLEFAAHLRDPATHPAPAGIESRRMAIYRDLFFNGIEGLLRGNFPVIVAVLGESQWRALVRSFYAEHRCTTPLFTEIGREFVEWLANAKNRAQKNRGQIPISGGNRNLTPIFLTPIFSSTPFSWLPELAHYEWVELALQISDATDPPHDPQGDLLDDAPVASALAWPLAYRWPVHRIAPDAVPDAPPPTPTLLLARRDTAGDVRFSELSPLAFRLLQRIDEASGESGDTLLRSLAIEAQAPDLGRFLADGTAMLRRLRDEGILLGTRPRC